MATWTEQTKNSTAYTEQTKQSTTFFQQIVAGGPWEYNTSFILYDDDINADTGLEVFYESIGVDPSWTEQTKN